MPPKSKTPATGGTKPTEKQNGPIEAGKIETNSGSVPAAAVIASAGDAGEVGGVPTSKPEVVGTSSGTNISAQGEPNAAVGDVEIRVVGADFASDQDEQVLGSARVREDGEGLMSRLVSEERHPRLVSMLIDSADRRHSVSAVRVTCAQDGFRRAGMRHPAGKTEYPLDHFDPAQLEIMLGEPLLTVELV